MKAILELTKDEAEGLMLLLNNSLKYSGFTDADNAIFFRNKITSAFELARKQELEQKTDN